MKKNATTQILEAECTLISVHWKGTPVFVKVRELSDLQIQAIGNFSLIGSEVASPANDWRAVTNSLELQHNVVKAALITPTYAEIFKIAGISDFSKEAEKRFAEINKDLISMARGPERSATEQRLASIRLLFDLVLPNDFTAEIAAYVLGTERTDIKLITKEILLNCAVLQKRSGGRPSDYCDGKLSAFNKRDIDTQAYLEYDALVENERKKAGVK